MVNVHNTFLKYSYGLTSNNLRKSDESNTLGPAYNE